MALSITQENFEKEIMQSAQPVVIDVFATWCGPCQHMMPIFEELSKEFGNKYKFASINVDEARDITIKFGVTSVPTFIFIKNGQVVGKETGYMSKENLQAKIETLLG